MNNKGIGTYGTIDEVDNGKTHFLLKKQLTICHLQISCHHKIKTTIMCHTSLQPICIGIVNLAHNQDLKVLWAPK